MLSHAELYAVSITLIIAIWVVLENLLQQGLCYINFLLQIFSFNYFYNMVVVAEKIFETQMMLRKIFAVFLSSFFFVS